MKDDKFENLMSVFSEWSARKPRNLSNATLTFTPDGSGKLTHDGYFVAIEFADIDEVIAYMERRIKAATVSE